MRIPSQPRPTLPAKLPRKQSPLLASCAIGLALVAVARAPEASAQSFDGSVTSATGASVLTSPGRTDVTVTAPRAVINWQPTDTVAGAAPIQFQSAPGTPTDGAFFSGNADYTVLNRILPTGAATGRAITLNGRVVSQIDPGSGAPVTGGNVWFYSPGGIAIGANATFDVGSLLLSTLDVTDADFLDGDSSFSFNTADGSTAAITIAPGAVISALNESSYVAMIAPRVDQAGTVNVNGTATYVAAEQATITMPGGLFRIDVTRGTTAAAAISHSGTTTGPGSTGAGDAHAIRMVAVPKNSAITMLVGGDLGYAASGAGVVNGVVQLYAGYDLPDGTTPTADNGGFAADIAVAGPTGGGVFLSSDLIARASRDISIVASEANGGIFATGGISLQADRNAMLSATRNFTVNGDLTVRGASLASGILGEESGYGGVLNVTGNLLFDASNTGAAGGGTGTGGIAGLTVPTGSLNVGGTLDILANGTGGSGGGNGVGGTARLAVTGGSVDLGNITISADGFGNGSLNSPALNGGDGTGGLAEFTQGGGDFLADFLSISANGTGGENDISLPGGSGGAGVGGDANFIKSGGIRTEVSSGLNLAALGNGGAATATGGNATSGDAVLQVTGATTTLGFVTVDISATGGSAGTGGTDGGASGIGHSARILAGGAGTTLDATAGIIVSADASVDANGANGGDLAAGAIQIEAQSAATITGGGFSQFFAEAFASSIADRTGAARGGSISIGGAGGNVTLNGSALLSVGGFSGDANIASGASVAGSATLFASNGGSLTFANNLEVYADSVGGTAPTGSNATGGSILAYAEDGTLTLGTSALFSATGTAGFNTGGTAPGTGTGGTITIQSRATAADLSAIVLGDFEGSAAGFGVEEGDGFIPTSGSAGHGIGGAIAVEMLGGTLNAATVSLDASAFGGVSLSTVGGAAPTGGNATGGTARFTMSGGTATVDTLSVVSTGFGGGVDSGASDPVAALAGSGTGGSATINTTGGTLNTIGITVRADGSGGAGASSFDGATSSGAAGLGGIARMTIGGTAAVNAGTVDILAIGTGGNGGDTASGLASAGGAGTGGFAELSILGGTLSASSAQISADGQGGRGGVSSDTGTPGDGGIGRGGSARLRSKGNFFAITDLAIGARGQGGAGGYEFGYGQGGGGGNGGTGFGGGAALELDYDPVIASLLIDASGIGGTGGDGVTGGNGGDGFGGINTGGGGAKLNLNAGALTVDTAVIQSDGTGGQGGFGSAGSGGNGGNGTGGDATIAVSGAGAVLTLSPDSSANATTLSAYGVGGGAGSSSIDPLGIGAAGGNGGAGTGGTVRVDILNGGRLLAGAFVGIAAAGLGGHASDGAGAAAGGGAGGNGGAGTGGNALLNLDGGVLLAFDPGAPLDWMINANGLGGNGGLGGDGATGGAGGNGAVGRGGSARITANNAEYALGAILLDAEGFGGSGQFGANGAVAGIGADGFGGIAGFSNSDDGISPPTGARSLTSLTLIAEGTGGLVADQPSGLDHAGRAELTDTASTSGGSVQIGALSALTRGLGGQPGAGFHLTSSGGPLTVSGDAFIDSGDIANFAFDGGGRFVVGNILSVLANGGIAITHTNPPSGTSFSSISAGQLDFATPGNFIADAASVLRSNSSILITAGGDIATGNLFAIDRINAYAGGNLTLGNAAVTATVFPPFGGAPTTGVIDLIAGNGSSGFVPADLTITGTVTATGHVSAQAGGDIIVASGANVISDNRVTFRSGDDILIRTGALVRAAANPLPEFGYGVTGPLDEPALLDLDAGAIAVAPAVPGNVAAIIVDGTIGAPDRAVTLTAGAIQADANAIDSKNFYAQLRGVPAAGSPANDDGGQLRADCVMGNICLGALGASNIVQIGPASGTVDLPARISLAGNINAADIVIRARDALDFHGAAAIHGTDRLFLAVLGGNLSGTGAFALSGDNLVNVYAGGSIVAPNGSITGAGNLGLGASGNIDLRTIAAGGLLQQIDGNGAVTQTDGLTLAGAFRASTLLSVGGGDLRLEAANGIAIGTLQIANGSALLQAPGGAVTVSTDVQTAGGVTADGQSVTLTAIGDLIVSDALASSGAITLTSNTGNLSLGAANAGTAFTANARGTATFNGQVAAQTIAVSSGDIAIGGGAQLGVIGRTTSVSLTNSDVTRQTFIGGVDTAAGYSLSAVEIGRIFGNSIGVTAPRVATLAPTSVGSTRAPDVIVGAFTLTGRAGGASGNLGSGTLSITTPGKLRVMGAVQLNGLTAANRFVITATDALEIDAATGSISLRDAAGGLGGVLAIGSDDIIAASLKAITDVGAAGATDAIDDRLAVNDGAVSEDGYFSANRIEVTARNGFYVQNSGATDDFADRRGFTVGTGGMAITTGSAATRIVINGRQSDGAGGFVTGVDLIDLVSTNGRTGRAVTGIDRRSTINGCLIANALFCSGIYIPESPLSREIFEVPLDPESAEEALNQLFPLTLIELRDFEPFGFEPLIDEPITGAGNDDLWVPECDPAIEQCEN